MKIVLLSDDYLPNSTRVHAKMLHELAMEFASKGHKIIVITPGCWQQADKVIVDDIDGIGVWRFKTKPTRGVGKVKRAINESMLSLHGYLALKNMINEQQFDVCIN